MPNTVTFDTKTANTILTTLSDLKKEISSLRKVLLNFQPENLWRAEIENGNKEIKKGKYKTYKSSEPFLKDLHKGI